MTSLVSAKRIPWYRQRWIKIASIVAGIAVALAIIAAVIVYAVWQSRPERALLDAAQYAAATPATYTVKTDQTDLVVAMNNQRFAADGTIDSMPISAVYTDNTLYVKSSQPQKLYDAYLADAVPQLFQSSVASIISTLKDRWVSLDIYKLTTGTGSNNTVTCGVETVNQLSSTDTPRLQMGLAYAANQFISTKTLDMTPIQSTYQLSLDQPKLKAFFADIATLDAFKNQPCISANSPVTNGDYVTTTADVTITQNDHHLRDITLRSASNVTTKIKADYTKVPTINIPTDVVTYDQIAGTLLRSLLPSFLGAQ